MSAQRSVVSSAKLIAMCTLASRVTGLIRDILLARAFGLGWIQDSFVYAFQFPNLFRRLFGEGAMAPVFVPTFTRTLEERGREDAWGLLARTLALLTVVLILVIIVIALIIAVIWLFWPGDPARQQANQLLLSLTALMLPFMLTICILALLSSILNCVGSFVPAALAPVLLNLCMIIAIAGLGPALYPARPGRQVYVVALAVVVAGVMQLILMVPVLRAHGVRLGWHWDPRDPVVQRMLRLLPPVALSQGVLAFGVFLDAQICVLLTHKLGTPATADWLGWRFHYPLDEGALSALTYAQRLYQFPLGVLVISLATAALPTFSRLAARQDWPAWTGEVRGALRLATFEGVLAGTMMIMLAEPITRLLFQRGNFNAADTVRVGHIVTIYGFGLWAFCAQHIVLRAFYSLGDVRTPLKITAVLLPLNVAINLSLIWFDAIREAAFAIGTSVTSCLAGVIGVMVLQRRLRTGLLDRATVLAIAQMLVAGVASALVLAVVQGHWSQLAGRIGQRLLSRSVETLGLLAIGGIVFAAVAWLLGSEEVRLMMPGRFRRRLRGG